MSNKRLSPLASEPSQEVAPILAEAPARVNVIDILDDLGVLPPDSWLRVFDDLEARRLLRWWLSDDR